MGVNIIIGCLLIIGTIILHGFFTTLAIRVARKSHSRKKSKKELIFEKNNPSLANVSFISSIVILMFISSIVVSLLWAYAYLLIGALDSFDDALYFSIVTYTTLGYGDITLGLDWRMLGSFQASIGIIMFGWSTAIVMYAVQKIYTNFK